MAKKRLDVNWERELGKDGIRPAVRRYERYLEDKGLSASTIPMYVLHVSKYLEFSATDSPSLDGFARFRGHLHDMKLSRRKLIAGTSRLWLDGSTQGLSRSEVSIS
jgi:hypothetical protein